MSGRERYEISEPDRQEDGRDTFNERKGQDLLHREPVEPDTTPPDKPKPVTLEDIDD